MNLEDLFAENPNQARIDEINSQIDELTMESIGLDFDGEFEGENQDKITQKIEKLRKELETLN